MVELVVSSVHKVVDKPQQRVVILKDNKGSRCLYIWIEPTIANAITIELQNVKSERPLTHDLLQSIITALQAHITRVEITSLKENIFHAKIYVEQTTEKGSRIFSFDSRASDAIAAALRAKCPIYVNENVMDEAAISLEDSELTLSKGDALSDKDNPDTTVFEEFINNLPTLDDL